MLVLFPSKKHKNSSVAMLCNDFLNSLEEKITAHFGTIYLISFTKFSLRSPAMRVKFSQTYKKITASFGVDYFLPLP